MKTKLFFTILITIVCYTANAQCHYIPATSTSTDTLAYSFSGGTFGSYGCAPIDPTYNLWGYGKSVTVTFVDPENYPSFRVWGMNDDDSASVSVNGTNYPLNSSSATYDAKVVCGISPGPDGVKFANGYLVGANNNIDGNYSYQNIQLNSTNVTSMIITGINGAGWGFAGVSVDCSIETNIDRSIAGDEQIHIYPNPFASSATLQFDFLIDNAVMNIYNLYGQKIKNIKNISGNEIQIDKENLPGGIYFIHLIKDNKVIAEDKLIIAD